MTLYTTPRLSGVGSLSETLDDLEKYIGKLGMKTGIQPIEILQRMDAAQTRIVELTEKGQDIRLEVERFAELGEVLRKNARLFLRSLGGQSLESLRSERKPPAEYWWWYLDQWHTAQVKRSVRRALIRGGIILAVLIVLAVVYELFLAPPPATRAKLDHQFQASQALQAEQPDFETALKEVTAALEYDPTDLDLLTLKGTLEEKLGKTAEAQQSLKTAQEAAPRTLDYLLALCNAYLQVYENEKSIDSAKQAIALAPDSAQAHFYLAQALYASNQKYDAYQTYQKAAELAEKENNIELVALIRVRLAYLTQEMAVPSGE